MPPAAPPPAGLESLQASIEGLRAVVVALAASRDASAGGGAKSASGGDAGDRVKALHTEASLLFLDLRAANRLTLESVERTREAARSAKRELDDKRLLLQNVQYEKGHVGKEIRTSSEFVSEYADDDVGLCDVETFFNEMKTELRTLSREEDDTTNASDASPMTTESLRTLDAHALTLKRLSHELKRREALVRRKKELEKKKASLTKSVKADKTFLDGLRGELSALRTAVEPLRAKLQGEGSNNDLASGLDAPSARRALREKSLPPPMYVLFTSLVAVAERRMKTSVTSETSVDKPSGELAVSLETGGEEVAKEDATEVGQGAKKRGEEEEEEEDEAPRRGRKRKAAVEDEAPTKPARGADAQTSGVVRAPGAHEARETRVVLGLGATGAAVVFRYFPSLGVVTAEVRSPKGAAGVGLAKAQKRRGAQKEEDILGKEKKLWTSLLVDLFPGDDGTRAPGAVIAGSRADATNETSENATEKETFLSHEWDVVGRRDRPFLWCQHLAGLDPTPLIPPIEVASLPGTDAVDESLAEVAEKTSNARDVSFENAAALERNVAAHAEQRRSATVVAALEARVLNVSSLERGAAFLADAAEARRGVSGLVEHLAHLHENDALTTPNANECSSRAVLTSFRETFGDETNVEAESDGFVWSGSGLSKRIAATGDGKSLAERGARRFALRVEVSNDSSADDPSQLRKSTSKTASHTSPRLLRLTLEVPASFPTRPISVALAARAGVGVSVSATRDRPPPSPADADADGDFLETTATNCSYGAVANDARLAEAEANKSVDGDFFDAENLANTSRAGETISGAGAALVRRVARVLRAAETYFSHGDDGNRRGRERRMA